MIAEKYRSMLPPYWYENLVAEYTFEGVGPETEREHAKNQEVLGQLLLPYATFSLPTWEWIYFGESRRTGGAGSSRGEVLYFDGRASFDGGFLFSGIKKDGTHEPTPLPPLSQPNKPKTVEERREAIRQKYQGKTRFTMKSLRAMGESCGKLELIEEDFSRKEIRFHFDGDSFVDIHRLMNTFENARPVHANRGVAIQKSKFENALEHTQSFSLRSHLHVATGVVTFDGAALFDGSILFDQAFIETEGTMRVIQNGSVIEEIPV